MDKMIPKKNEVVDINGTTIYYEVYGQGQPLLLLHGYTQSSVFWQEYVKEYADDFEVYLIDLRGHGKSGKFTEDLSVRAVSDDVLALLQYFNIAKVKGIGLSFGGDVLLGLACLSPNLVESMVIIGANGNWNSQDFPDMLNTFNYEHVEEFQWIRDFHAGGEAQVKAVLEQLANYKIKITDNELKKITAKTLLVLGDQAEQISIDSVVHLYKTVADSCLWVVPNMGHYAHDGDNRPEFLRVSKAFLVEEPNR